ncbi:uncharacterized protein LOC136086646 isoform X1 [Hydra vulgaris]|uniref:Uncharacterized protein LOC136086646 isoform X1 n=1 Tax=Hydra vulgaris TaxID=6087 RepID=A0ABM4CSN1_HYDVU
MFSALQTLVAVKTSELPKCIDLAVKTLLDLKTLEKNIKNKEYAQSVSNYLGVTGGLNVNDTTRCVLEKVFTNNLAKQLNWAGRCNKTGVKNLQVVHCVKDVVLKNESEISTNVVII